jgi:MoxR-like ATPase
MIMAEREMKLDGKTVKLKKPEPPICPPLSGREEEMKRVYAGWICGPGRVPLNPLLIGDPGVGKTDFVRHIAFKFSKELYTFTGHDDISSEEFVCAVRVSDDPDRKFDYIPLELAAAMLRGQIFFLDGIGKMRKRALALLESVLDGRRYLNSNILGERIYAHPGFRFIAATNPSDLDGDQLPDFIKSRCRPIVHFGYPKPEELKQIVVTHYPLLREGINALMDHFWGLWREKFGNMPPSPRDAVNFMTYAQNVADREKMETTGMLSLESPVALTKIEKAQLETAFNEFFNSLNGGQSEGKSFDAQVP